MNKFKWILSIGITLVLFGCGQDESKLEIDANGELNESNIETINYSNVNNIGDVNTFNKSFENEVITLILNYSEYLSDITPYLKGEKNNKDEFKKIARDFELYINTISITPTTSLEKETIEYIDSALYHMKQDAKYTIKYAETGESVYHKMRVDENTDVRLDLEMIEEILEKGR